MLAFKKIKVGKKYIQGVAITLLKHNLVLLRGSRGYIMCGYLDMAVADRFRDIAVKITGVNTIGDAIKSKVHSLSRAASKAGIYKGQAVKKVLKIIV
ncbi:MAG: DUF1805 domain-containing protein [Candidatus Omnitrophica bacterium]|nr:DUF1805 domain-containing protein [Candidatus Omnitrophota bacterium]